MCGNVGYKYCWNDKEGSFCLSIRPKLKHMNIRSGAWDMDLYLWCAYVRCFDDVKCFINLSCLVSFCLPFPPLSTWSWVVRRLYRAWGEMMLIQLTFNTVTSDRADCRDQTVYIGMRANAIYIAYTWNKVCADMYILKPNLIFRGTFSNPDTIGTEWLVSLM